MKHPTKQLEVATALGAADAPGPGTKSFGSPLPTSSSGRRSSGRQPWPSPRYSPYARPQAPSATAGERVQQPTTPGLSASMHEMGLSGPISCRTRSQLRRPGFNSRPRQLTPLDPAETLNADLLSMIGELASERVPTAASGTKPIGRSRGSKRLEPLQGAAAGCPEGFSAAAGLALARLESL